MEGFAKQRLRRYARRREAVRERDTGAAGSIVDEAPRVVEGRGGAGLARAAA